MTDEIDVGALIRGARPKPPPSTAENGAFRHIHKCEYARPCPLCTWWYCVLVPCGCSPSRVWTVHKSGAAHA
jgi:hypothetical protein